MSSLRNAPVAIAFVAFLSCAAPPERSMALLEVTSPAGEGSGEPNLALAADGRVLLSWIEPAGKEGHALRFSTLDGDTWSAPRTIAHGTGWVVNWADFPAMGSLPDGTLFAHWLAKSGPSTYAYDVRMVVSRDGGQTWSAFVTPHRDGTKTEHGFVSLAPSDDGGMGVVWLDGRKTAGASHGDHGGAGAEMALLHTTLDADGKLGAERVLDPRVCDCCQTDAAHARSGPVVVYRDRSPNETRDISIVRATAGGWSEPRPVAADQWVINGCPVNGPAVAADGDRVAVAWFTGAADKPMVKVALSSDSGASFAPPIVVSDARPLGRVDVALVDGSAAVVLWLEQGEAGAAALSMRRAALDGSLGPTKILAASTGARSSGFPRMAWAGGRLVIAWRDATEPPRVRTGIVPIA